MKIMQVTRIVVLSMLCMSSVACLHEWRPSDGNPRQKVGGRFHWVQTEDYDLYSRKPNEARKLKPWIDSQLKTFRRSFMTEPDGRGLVFAIERGEEPAIGVVDWVRRNINRTRTVHLSERVSYDNGRPYCISRGNPFFRESFVVPVSETVELGIVESTGICPAWICFLTTDRHLLNAFDRAMAETKATAVFIDDGLGILKLMRWIIFRQYRSIDLRLMRLQRKETLLKALIHSSRELQPYAEQLVKDLVVITDKKFGKLFMSRLTD